MSAALYWARAQLRNRWRSWLSVALVAGIGGGLVMASIAGARRTQTAYPRLLEWADSPDVVIDPDFEGPEPAEFMDAVEALPGVAFVSDARAVALGRVEGDRIALGDVGDAMVTYGDRYYVHDRVLVTQGRLPALDRADEVLVSTSFAEEEGVGVGSRLAFRTVDVSELFEAFEAGDESLPAASGEPVDVTITGVGIFPELAVAAEDNPQERILVTPALDRALPEGSRLWRRTGLHLADGASVADVRSQVQELAAQAGGSSLFEVRADITDRAQRSVRPYVLALAGLGVAGVVFVGLLTLQLVRRIVLSATRDRELLWSLAADRRTTLAGSAIPALVAAALAGGLAVAVATSVSSFTPVGPVGDIEIDPGAHVDWLVVGPGLLTLMALVVAPALSGSRAARRRPVAVGWLAGWVQRSGLPLSVALGVRSATGDGERERRRAARSGSVIVVLALAMLVSVVSFAASVEHLLDNPELHGWNADVALVGADGYGTFDVRAAGEVEGLDALSGAVFGSFGIEGEEVAGLGTVSLVGTWAPPLVEGRMPAAMDEVLLGERTLAATGADVGDAVAVRLPGDDEAMPMTVTGTAIFPGVGQFDNDRATLGDGALVALPPEMIDEIGMGWAALFADISGGVDRDRVVADLVSAADELSGETEVLEVVRPADVGAFARLGSVPWLLLGLFSAVALTALVHALLVSVRTWRRDRAVLLALGATPRELRSAVRWQSATMVATALLVAVPAGLVIGRWAWRSLAVEIGVQPVVVVPVAALFGLSLVLLAAALAATAIPDRVAGRAHPVDHLRTE